MSRASTDAPLNAFLQSPLQGFDWQSLARAPGAADGVLACELAHLGYVIVRGRADDADFLERVGSVLGSPLPTGPTSFARWSHGAALWLSPDEWMLVCPRAARDGWVGSLNAALAGVFAQVVDVSGGFTTLRLAGKDHVRLLRHLGPYDFERLQIGRCVGTVFSKATVSVVRADAAGVLLVFRRSFADYVWRLVERAARPYGLCVVTPQHCADPLFAPLLEAA
ncbi:sarcosine oxidase subunit gamma [Aquincola sp. S2]|uniref:Sarcosine oxidase subunit gamma n=1 Tax=Pseudaquabacterium terrae TaxID=2732868 RepID=A0ABX2EV47_9BURK|nr:sarcosine oxidase subunit gamma family protein [Aquabacterium terrae]NRF72294.1 sarcosine oxidase subunit gamma [Aquabacterium terrae]